MAAALEHRIKREENGSVTPFPAMNEDWNAKSRSEERLFTNTGNSVQGRYRRKAAAVFFFRAARPIPVIPMQSRSMLDGSGTLDEVTWP
jgi:hypothetical protein